MDRMEKFLHKIGAYRLKDLIRAIRACKTAAAERAVIAKESAFIRTSIKEDTGTLRYINVSKLLYIHMLGYPAHFGQLECLKLAASPKFTDKKLGYLGIMMLLDENQDILTLVTNSLQNDLNSPNPFVVSLALCTLGNIASLDMTRDLATDIERLMSTANSFIKKKAILCALRIIKKNPSSKELFIPIAKNLLGERNHGVLLTGCTLILELCNMDETFRLEMQTSSVPVLVRHMQNFSTVGYSSEHDVGGITDPFLQVKILKLMGVLGRGSVEASDFMNDTLAQVATNTESTRNVGNAILYECVLTIMEIKSDSSLRVLAINILARFLANKDNNIRYVGLTTLTRTSMQSTSVIQEPSSTNQSIDNNALISDFLGETPKPTEDSQAQATTISDSNALQRHRGVILDCLKDSDISIRRRALDLAFLLITKDNIRLLARELLAFLEVCEKDIKLSVSSRLVDYATRYRPNERWLADTIIRTLRVAGAFVNQSIVNRFLKLVVTVSDQDSGDLSRYVVRKLFNILFNEVERAFEQEGLVIAAVWCIGEYGDVLVQGASEQTKAMYFTNKGLYMKEEDRRRQFALANRAAHANESSDDALDDGFGDYGDGDGIDADTKQPSADKDILIDIFDSIPSVSGVGSPAVPKSNTSAATASKDLFDIFASPAPTMGSTHSAPTAVVGNKNSSNGFGTPATSFGAPAATTTTTTTNNNNNLLDDLFGQNSNAWSSTSGTTMNAQPVTSSVNPLDDILGGFGRGTTTSTWSTPAKPTTTTTTVSTTHPSDPLADLLGGFGTSNAASTAPLVSRPVTTTLAPSMMTTTPATSATLTTIGAPAAPSVSSVMSVGILAGTADDDEAGNDVTLAVPTEDVVLDLLAAILRSPFATAPVREHVVTCLLKLATRLRGDDTSRTRIDRMVAALETAHGLELQQRAAEAGVLLTHLPPSLLATATERVPPPPPRADTTAGY